MSTYYYALNAATGEMREGLPSLEAALRALAEMAGIARGELVLEDRSSSCGSEIRYEVATARYSADGTGGEIIGTVGSDEAIEPLTTAEQSRLAKLTTATQSLDRTPLSVVGRVAYICAPRDQALRTIPAILDLGLALVVESDRQSFAMPVHERPVVLSVHLADDYYSDAVEEIEPPPGWEDRAVERARAEGVFGQGPDPACVNVTLYKSFRGAVGARIYRPDGATEITSHDNEALARAAVERTCAERGWPPPSFIFDEAEGH